MSFITYIMALRKTVFLIVIIYAICPLFAAAQAGRAELFGVIRDSSGGAIPGAAVQAEDQATMVRYSATSDDRGEYHLVGLPASNYVVTVEQPGFRMYRQSGITLRLAERTVLDLTLAGRTDHSDSRSDGVGALAADRQRRSQYEYGREEGDEPAAGRAKLHSSGDDGSRCSVARRWIGPASH